MITTRWCEIGAHSVSIVAFHGKHRRPNRAQEILLLLGCILILAGCGSGNDDEPSVDEASLFENVTNEASFVGDAACFDCHEDEYRGYQEHGMANSVYPVSPDREVERFPSPEIRDERQDLVYRAYREGDRYFQEEYRIDGEGNRSHHLVREMVLVMGSGTAARTYLTRQDDRYYELPLTWYTQEERWAFSPGYEVVNQRFDRTIPDRCMNCHNNFPEPILFADGAYLEVPHGIGCERCHGPGSIHVDERLSFPEPADSIDRTIVNPAHLSLDRRLDVCQQCHLNATVSILKEGRTAYDYRPAQALSDYMALFAAATGGDEIEVISHADRMRQSPCFIETQTRENPMDCLTCHNPHEGFRDAGPSYFNDTCQSCHGIAGLQEAMPSLELRAVHSATSNCFSCHMPKYEGTPHASFTDHYIRVVEEKPEASRTAPIDTAPAAPESRLEPVALEAYFDEDSEEVDVYRGMAYVVYGRQRGDSTSLRRGIELLSRHAQDDHGEALFLLGFAHLQLGEVTEAIPALEAAILADAGVPERLNALAQAYEADGRTPSSVERLYRRALDIQPALSSVRVNYGRFLEAQGRLDDAIEQYRAAIDAEPWLETAHYNLGTALLRQGDLEDAGRALLEAVELDPDYGDALSNLGLMFAAQGREAEAGAYFRRAVEAEPNNAVALGNLGAFHLNNDDLADAVRLLTRAVEQDPVYVDGLANLALVHFRLDQYDRAQRYAERALRLDPQNPLAREILGAI